MTLAIKVVDLSKADSQTVSGYKNEITLLSQLRKCKRVVRMYDYEYHNSGQQLLVVMEKGDSDLSHVLTSFIDSKEKTSLDPHLIRFYWQEMVKAVSDTLLTIKVSLFLLDCFCILRFTKSIKKVLFIQTSSQLISF